MIPGLVVLREAMPLCPEGPVSHVDCPVVQWLAKLPPGAALAIFVSFQSQTGGGHTVAQPLSPLEMTISLEILLMMKEGILFT